MYAKLLREDAALKAVSESRVRSLPPLGAERGTGSGRAALPAFATAEQFRGSLGRGRPGPSAATVPTGSLGSSQDEVVVLADRCKDLNPYVFVISRMLAVKRQAKIDKPGMAALAFKNGWLDASQSTFSLSSSQLNSLQVRAKL